MGASRSQKHIQNRPSRLGVAVYMGSGERSGLWWPELKHSSSSKDLDLQSLSRLKDKWMGPAPVSSFFTNILEVAVIAHGFHSVPLRLSEIMLSPH